MQRFAPRLFPDGEVHACLRDSYVQVFFVYFVPLFVARVFATVLTGANPLQLRGLLSDLVVAGLFSAIAWIAGRRRYLFPALWVFWALVFALNVEHIRVNGSNADFAFAVLGFRPEFISGSVFSLNTLISISCVFALSVPLLFLTGKLDRIRMSRNLQAVVFFALLFIIVTMPVRPETPDWMQMNLLEENALRLVKPDTGGGAEYADADSEMLERFFEHDLSGRPVLDYPAYRPNVLVLILEGISYGIFTEEHMPRFTGLARRGISYPRFLGTQRQSQRGLYAIFCGDYPNMVSTDAKSDIIAVKGPPRPCLPEILRSNGYATAFFQSTSLRFENMDRFTDAAGFDIARQAAHSDTEGTQSGWGVDDRQLFMRTLDVLDELEASGRPWFLGVFTVGTHHPYNIPGKPYATYEDAVHFADSALGELVDALEARGVFDDTIVIVTSDESARKYSGGTEQGQAFGYNHIPLVVLVPAGPENVSPEEVFTQSDIQLSILDCLGIVPDGQYGRSIFRSYGSMRPLMFGNIYASRFYGYFPGGRLLVCKRDYKCDAHDLGADGLFGAWGARSGPSRVETSTLASAVRASDLSWGALDDEYVFRQRDTGYSGNQLIMGGFSLSLERGESLSWHLDIEAIDPAKVRVIITGKEASSSDGKGGRESIIYAGEKASQSGGTIMFDHEFKAPADMEQVLTTILVDAGEDSRYLVRDLGVRKMGAP